MLLYTHHRISHIESTDTQIQVLWAKSMPDTSFYVFKIDYIVYSYWPLDTYPSTMSVDRTIAFECCVLIEVLRNRQAHVK